MANVSYWSSSWVSGVGAPPLASGETHEWISWGFNYGDVLNVSAHPVTAGDPVILEVQNIRIEHDVTGQRLYFTVKNVGNLFTRGYAMAFSIITP